ncbi:MAG: hypothetical protein IBJ13_02480 [Sphingopyxis sp.]|nr:hypothetical protein [Sphingopyxis sp.]
MLLLIAAMIAGDPTEIAGDPMDVVGSLLSLLTMGSVPATIFSVLVGWVPISFIGWAIWSAGTRWPALRGRAVWAAAGMVAGGFCVALLAGTVDDVLKGQDPAAWERLRDMALFGSGCGIFAALLFHWLVTRTPRKPTISDGLVTEHLP